MQLRLIVIVAVFLMPSCATTKEVRLEGEVSHDGKNDILLSLELSNDTGESICFESWFVSRETVVETMFEDSFIVVRDDGSFAPYQSNIARRDPRSSNRTVFLLKDGEQANAVVNLSKLYELESGAYTVSYLLAVMSCSDYLYPDSRITPSNNLKYLFTIGRSLDIPAPEKIVELSPIEFEVSPDK